jgi:hypothetical protein
MPETTTQDGEASEKHALETSKVAEHPSKKVAKGDVKIDTAFNVTQIITIHVGA